VEIADRRSTSYLITNLVAGLVGHFPRHKSASDFELRPPQSLLSVMLRLSLLAYTRPLLGPTVLRSGPHVLPLRTFGSTARPRILEALRNRSPSFFTKPFQQSSRSIVDSAVVSRPSQTEAWRRYAITAVCRVVIIITLFESMLTNPQATVAGTIVGVEVFLNRDTRDSLSVAERSYLHDAFKYTGGGLVLTALAARSMFRTGLPFRIMSANPCE
jgi:hypothetical protein